jgi:hypothetical protein
VQEHLPAATVGSQNPGEGSREKNFKVAATEAGVRFFLKGNCENSLRPKLLHLQNVEGGRSGRRFGPQSLNVAIKQMT